MMISADDAKRQVKGSIRARKLSDTILSSLWILIPLLIAVANIVISISLTFWGLSRYDIYTTSDYYESQEYYLTTAVPLVVGTIPSVILGILTYLLVKRQNEHYRRESQFRIGIISYLRALASSPEKEYSIASEIATLNTIHSQSNLSERQRSPLAWALVILLPSVIGIAMGLGILLMISSIGDWTAPDDSLLFGIIVLASIGGLLAFILIVLEFYLLYFLMKTIYEHDVRWYSTTQQINWGFYKLGYNVGQPVWAPLPKRSFLLYFILTILTLGLFMYYWWYILIKDPNVHFKNQWYYEDMVAGAISQ